MVKLEHCPFCGSTIAPQIMLLSEAEYMDEGSPEYAWASTHFVAVCNYNRGGCGANIVCNDGGEIEAAEKWNRRAEYV